MSRSSPFKDSINRISHKLFSINTAVESDKQPKLEHLENKIKTLDDELNNYNQILEKKFSSMKENVIKLQKSVAEEKIKNDQNFETKRKEIINIDQKFQQALDSETIIRREGENKITRLIEDRLMSLNNEISRESQTRTENIELISQCLEADLPRINNAIKNNSIEREEVDQNVLKKTSEELIKLNNIILQEKKSREESEQSIYDMLKDVINRVKGEIDHEKKIREGTEETLLNLLENACVKLNS